MNYSSNGLVGGQESAAKQNIARGIEHNPTVEENIDNRIHICEMEIARLKQSKVDLSPLLKMRIRDIRSAMDY